MTKPHRLKWFQERIGTTIKRRDFITHKMVEIYVEDIKHCQRLFYTQFDVGFRFTNNKK